jgi:hypothetical protein
VSDLRPLGFSTGALAHGDFRRALGLVAPLRAELGLDAVELSALRFEELAPLIASLDEIAPALAPYSHVSLHAPSHYPAAAEPELARRLADEVPAPWTLVLHPDAVHDPDLWLPLGHRLAIENMDGRKPGRTVGELAPLFDRLPEARFCLDLAHALQVDPTGGEAGRLLGAFGERLAEIHLSRIDDTGRHLGLDAATVASVAVLAPRIPATAPVILETPAATGELARQVDHARRACP